MTAWRAQENLRKYNTGIALTLFNAMDNKLQKKKTIKSIVYEFDKSRPQTSPELARTYFLNKARLCTESSACTGGCVQETRHRTHILIAHSRADHLLYRQLRFSLMRVSGISTRGQGYKDWLKAQEEDIREAWKEVRKWASRAQLCSKYAPPFPLSQVENGKAWVIHAHFYESHR